jgi:hypothetical protein
MMNRKYEYLCTCSLHNFPHVFNSVWGEEGVSNRSSAGFRQILSSILTHKYSIRKGYENGQYVILVIDKSNGKRSSHEKIRQHLHSTVFVWHTTMVFPNHFISTCMNAENTMIEFFVMLIDKVLKNHPLPPTASDKKLPENLAWAVAVDRLMCLHCKNFKQIFPEKEQRDHSHIQVSVSDLYLPTIGLPILLQLNRLTDRENI